MTDILFNRPRGVYPVWPSKGQISSPKERQEYPYGGPEAWGVQGIAAEKMTRVAENALAVGAAGWGWDEWIQRDGQAECRGAVAALSSLVVDSLILAGWSLDPNPGKTTYRSAAAVGLVDAALNAWISSKFGPVDDLVGTVVHGATTGAIFYAVRNYNPIAGTSNTWYGKENPMSGGLPTNCIQCP